MTIMPKLVTIPSYRSGPLNKTGWKCGVLEPLRVAACKTYQGAGKAEVPGWIGTTYCTEPTVSIVPGYATVRTYQTRPNLQPNH